MHLSDAVLESVMVFRLAAGAVAEVVVPLCLANSIYNIMSHTVLYINILSYIYINILYDILNEIWVFTLILIL